MPLLISSRMMSAGLTPSSPASSLTVIVPGSSIAPRSRGSSVWTPAPPNAPSRRGGLRGPRRPRVPLLLLATRSSFDHQFIHRCGVCHQGPRERASHVRREWCLERPAQAALGERCLQAGSRPADIGAAGRRTPARVRDYLTGRCANDTLELAFRPDGPARDAGPIRRPTRGRRGRGAAYDATSSVDAVGPTFFDACFGFAATASSSGDPLSSVVAAASSSVVAAASASAAAAAFFVTRFGFAGG